MSIIHGAFSVPRAKPCRLEMAIQVDAAEHLAPCERLLAWAPPQMDGLPLSILYLALGRHLYKPTGRMAQLLPRRVKQLCERGELSEDSLVNIVWGSSQLALPLGHDVWRAVEARLVTALAEGSLVQQVRTRGVGCLFGGSSVPSLVLGLHCA